MIKIRTRVDQKKIKKAVAQSFRDYDKKKMLFASITIRYSILLTIQCTVKRNNHGIFS